MTRGQRFLAKSDMTLRANESRIRFLLIDLEIQRPTIVGCRRDVTTFSSAA